MIENGRSPKLDVEMRVIVTNPEMGRGYEITARAQAEPGETRRETIDKLVDEVLETPITAEMKRIEGWPL